MKLVRNPMAMLVLETKLERGNGRGGVLIRNMFLVEG